MSFQFVSDWTYALTVIGAGTLFIVGMWAAIGLLRLLTMVLLWRGGLGRLLTGGWRPGPEFHSWPGNRWWWRDE